MTDSTPAALTDATSAALTDATTTSDRSPTWPGGRRELLCAVIFAATVLGVIALIAIAVNASASAAGGCGGG
jgi:hypothetical protein